LTSSEGEKIIKSKTNAYLEDFYDKHKYYKLDFYDDSIKVTECKKSAMKIDGYYGEERCGLFRKSIIKIAYFKIGEMDWFFLDGIIIKFDDRNLSILKNKVIPFLYYEYVFKIADFQKRCLHRHRSREDDYYMNILEIIYNIYKKYRE